MVKSVGAFSEILVKGAIPPLPPQTKLNFEQIGGNDCFWPQRYWGWNEMNSKLVKKLSLGAESYVTITWKGFFTQCQVLLSSIVDHKLYASDYDSDSCFVAMVKPALEKRVAYMFGLFLNPGASYPASSSFSRPDATLRKGEKRLRETVCFSIEYACPRDTYVKWQHFLLFRRKHFGNIRNLNIQRQDDNERERQQNIWFNKQINNFARASLFFGISLPFLYDYDVKMPNFVFYG